MSEYICEITEYRSSFGESFTWATEYKEPIVRCRDCKWLDHRNLCLCMLPDGDGGYACWVVEPDGFCAWGIKRVSE